VPVEGLAINPFNFITKQQFISRTPHRPLAIGLIKRSDKFAPQSAKIPMKSKMKTTPKNFGAEKAGKLCQKAGRATSS